MREAGHLNFHPMHCAMDRWRQCKLAWKPGARTLGILEPAFGTSMAPGHGSAGLSTANDMRARRLLHGKDSVGTNYLLPHQEGLSPSTERLSAGAQEFKAELLPQFSTEKCCPQQSNTISLDEINCYVCYSNNYANYHVINIPTDFTKTTKSPEENN